MGCPRPATLRSDPYDIGELRRDLRDRIYTACLDAPSRGLVLVSGYRDPGRQWDLRHDRCPGRECDRGCRGNPVTAIPYASKHQTRDAADMGGRDLGWLVSNHRRYGLRRTVPSERWHYEAIGTPTVRIRRYPSRTYDGQAGGTPVTVPPPREDFFIVNDAEARELFKDLRTRTNEVEAKADRVLASLTRLEGALAAVANKPAIVRDPRDNRAWLVDGNARTHVPDGEVLNALVYMGQAGNPGREMPHADPKWLDKIPVAR